MKTICLVIGHGNGDPGAINTKYNISEYFINKLLVDSITPMVTDNKIVIVNRTTYKELPQLINDTEADFCIEFHSNAFDSKTKGFEVLYYKDSITGNTLATKLHKCLKSSLVSTDRGIKNLSKADRGAYLLQNTTMPTVIVESFFIDNNEDLESYLKHFFIYSANLITTLNNL
jgi:N-acetylmuramoyl-L-alanine amidase